MHLFFFYKNQNWISYCVNHIFKPDRSILIKCIYNFYLDNTAGTDVVPAEFASVGPGEEEPELDLHADEAGLAGLQV